MLDPVAMLLIERSDLFAPIVVFFFCTIYVVLGVVKEGSVVFPFESWLFVDEHGFLGN